MKNLIIQEKKYNFTEKEIRGVRLSTMDYEKIKHATKKYADQVGKKELIEKTDNQTLRSYFVECMKNKYNFKFLRPIVEEYFNKKNEE